MTGMVTDTILMDTLPTEILEDILCHVGVENVSSVARACNRFNAILNSSEKVWKRLFQSRFRRLSQPCCRAELLLLHAQYGRSWRCLAEFRASAGRQLRSALDHMANRYHALDGLPDPAMEDFRGLARENGTFVMRDALLDEIFPPQHHRPSHLSRQYYGSMLYREVQRDAVVRPLMRRFLARPAEEATVSQVYHLMAMWISPELGPCRPPDVDGYNARLAGLVLEEVRRRCPEHPAAGWAAARPGPRGPTLWTDEQALQLLDCINHVLYGRLRLTDDDGPEEPADAELHATLLDVHGHYLDAGSGMEGVMSSVYVSVAGRLGVEVHHIRLADSWLVRWQKTGDDQCLFVDITQGGQQLSMEEARETLKVVCPGAHHWLLLEPMSELKLLSRQVAGAFQKKWACPMTEADSMAVRSLLFWTLADCEPAQLQLTPLCLVLETERPMYLRRLCQEYLRAGERPEDEVNRLVEYIQYLEQKYQQKRNWLNNEEWKQAIISSRASSHCDSRLRVGDVVQYRAGGGRLAVVHGIHHGVRPLLDGAPKDRYHIMIDGDDLASYVEEEELEPAEEPRPVHHLQLGRYFAGLDAGRYVPLPWLARLYPAPQQQVTVSTDTSQHEEDEDAPTDWLGSWPPVLPEDEEAVAGDQVLAEGH